MLRHDHALTDRNVWQVRNRSNSLRIGHAARSKPRTRHPHFDHSLRETEIDRPRAVSAHATGARFHLWSCVEAVEGSYDSNFTVSAVYEGVNELERAKSPPWLRRGVFG